MSSFTALKTAINNAIKTNGNEEITGAILQTILDAMVETLGDSAITDLENAITTEVTNRENAVGDVAADLAAEALARANKDNQLDGRIDQEEYNRQNADAALSRTVDQGFQTLGSQMTALNEAISALNAAYQNGYLYGGIATPSSSPSNNKCFYIALQGGTYTNFGGVGVVEGINIIKNDSGWKVEHIYDQTTLLNEFYLLRQQVIRAISSIDPIVIQGDVTNAPDEEDLTSDAQNLLKFKDRAYSPLNFSGLGMKILRKNIAPLSDSAAFNGFVEGVTAEETLAGTPELIFWDRMNTRFIGIKDGVYYLDWTDSDNYVPVSTSLVYMYNGTPYQWTGSDFIVNETEVPNLVNCLTQDMINEANTIYIIRYDYTLKKDITIPANCVLQFDGGSISGEHTITGTNTGLQAGLVKIFNTDVTLAGTWNIAKSYPEWFGAKGDGESDDSLAVQAAVNFSSGFRAPVIHFSSKIYIVDGILLSSRVCIEGEGITTQLISDSVDKSMFYNVASTPIHVSKFKDFNLNFNSAKTVPTIDILNSYGCEFENLWVNGSSTSGNNVPTIKLHRDGSATTYITRIRNSRFIYATIFIESTDSIITDNIINGTGKEYALVLYNSGNTNIENNQMVAGSVSAIHVTGTYNQEGLKIVGNYFDGAPIGIRVGGAIKMSQTLINSVISSNNFWKIHAEAIFGTNIRLSTIIGNSFQDCGYFDDTLADIHLSTVSFGLAIIGNIFVKEVYYNGTSVVNRVNNAKILQLDTLPSSAVRPSIFANNIAQGKYALNELGEYYYLGYNVGNQGLYNANPGKGKTPNYNVAFDTEVNMATFQVNGAWVDAYNYPASKRRVGREYQRSTMTSGGDIGFPYYDITTNRWIAWNGTKWKDDRGYSYTTKIWGGRNDRPTNLTNGDIGFTYFNDSANKMNYWDWPSGAANGRWLEADGSLADVARSGTFTTASNISAENIYNGFMFMINDGDDHFPIYAVKRQVSATGFVVDWYKADGTQYTG